MEPCSGEMTESDYGSRCFGYQPREPKVESWHGFKKGERVRWVDTDGCGNGDLGTVLGGGIGYVHVHYDGYGYDSKSMPSGLRHVCTTTEPKAPGVFKVGDRVRVKKVRSERQWVKGSRRIARIEGRKHRLENSPDDFWWAESLEHV
jgi:hypothetical protein